MSLDPLADFDAEIIQFLQSVGVSPDLIQLSTPPEREYGERATNVAFRLARERGQAPRQIAEQIAGQFSANRYRFIARVEAAGAGFINVYLNYAAFIPHLVGAVREAGALYGHRPGSASQRVVVEHTSVNPNKEWHIGHVRNAVMGDVVARLLRLAGNEVQIQNYVDDTGLQAAAAVVGLRDFPEQQQPAEKYDHYVGRHYVKINAELGAEKELRARLDEIERGAAAEQEERRSIEARLENVERLKKAVMQTMHALEEGEYHATIERILNAQLETAYRLGAYYDLLAWESHIVQSHTFDEAMERLGESPKVYSATHGHYEGALVIEMRPATRGGEEPKSEVLIRRTGIPTYIAKDIAYHMWKFRLLPDRLCYVHYSTQPNGEELWSTALEGGSRPDDPPERIINVIAVNQSQAQDTVKEALRVAGFAHAADELVHLAYGLVSTREGKISGRKGTAVAGDNVINEAVRVAYERVKEKRSQDLADDEMQTIAEAVGVGALRYFMVQYNPLTDIVFDVGDVVSYDGNTGLYVQYALVRMFAILRKAQTEQGLTDQMIDEADAALLQHEQEKRLAHHLALFPAVVADASRTLSVNLVAEFAFDLATIFSQFYRDCPVLIAEPALRNARLLLVRTVRDVLSNVCNTLGVPVIERL